MRGDGPPLPSGIRPGERSPETPRTSARHRINAGATEFRLESVRFQTTFPSMKTMLVSEAKPILGELVRKASMGQEIRISTGGYVARLVAGEESQSTGEEMVAHMTGRRKGKFRTDDVMKAVRR